MVFHPLPTLGGGRAHRNHGEGGLDGAGIAEGSEEDELLRISFAGILDVDRFSEAFLLTEQGAQIHLGCWPDPDFGDSYLCLPGSPLGPGAFTAVVEVEGVTLDFEFVL